MNEKDERMVCTNCGKTFKEKYQKDTLCPECYEKSKN